MTDDQAIAIDDPAQPVDHILDKMAREIAAHPMKKRHVYALLCRVYQMGKNSVAEAPQADVQPAPTALLPKG